MPPTSNPETLVTLMESMAENSVAITQVTGELASLNSRLTEAVKELRLFREEIKKTLSDHENRLVGVEHNCLREASWNRCWDRLEALEKSEMQRCGAKPYEDRIWGILQAVLVAVIVALVLWFMKGGQII
jgi:hypothetical protein